MRHDGIQINCSQLHQHILTPFSSLFRTFHLSVHSPREISSKVHEAVDGHLIGQDLHSCSIHGVARVGDE